MFKKHTLKHLLSFYLIGILSIATADTNDATFIITMKDGVVTPNQIDAKADSTIVIKVTNTGKSTAEFESKLLHIEKVLMSGASATFTFKNLAPGDYEFVDEFTEDQKTAHGFISVK